MQNEIKALAQIDLNEKLAMQNEIKALVQMTSMKN